VLTIEKLAEMVYVQDYTVKFFCFCGQDLKLQQLKQVIKFLDEKLAQSDSHISQTTDIHFMASRGFDFRHLGSPSPVAEVIPFKQNEVEVLRTQIGQRGGAETPSCHYSSEEEEEKELN